jgi:hypothetical protein
MTDLIIYFLFSLLFFVLLVFFGFNMSEFNQKQEELELRITVLENPYVFNIGEEVYFRGLLCKIVNRQRLNKEKLKTYDVIILSDINNSNTFGYQARIVEKELEPKQS